MSGTFLISPVNSLTFKNFDGLLPSYDNTLDANDTYMNSVNSPSCQKFLSDDVITTQLRTDYDTVVATLYGSDDLPISVTVTLKTSYTDYDFYEFVLSGLANDVYRMVVTAVKSGYDNVEWRSEFFSIVDDFGNEDYLKVAYYNDENSFYVDYSTDIQHFFWIPAINFKINPKGEIDVYNNLDNEEKLEETNFRVYTFESKQILRHIALKFVEGSSMDNFKVNDVEFIRNPKTEFEYLSNYNHVLINSELTQKYSVGVNSDDQGYATVEQEISEGLVMNIGQDDLSAGALELTVPDGYAVRFADWALKSGTSASVKIGTTVGGDEISRLLTSTVVDEPVSISTSDVLNWDGTGTVYVTKTGVGAIIDFWLTLITYKYITP